MKAIIDGKMYNTDTAESIANWWNGLGRGDFNNADETLYLTKKGNFFLHGEGGANTKWGRRCGNNARCGGSGIEPISKKDALSWMERNGEVNLIEQYFPDMIEEA